MNAKWACHWGKTTSKQRSMDGKMCHYWCVLEMLIQRITQHLGFTTSALFKKKSYLMMNILGEKKIVRPPLKKMVWLHSCILYWFIYQFHFMFIYQLIKRINYKLGKDTPTSSFDENEYMYSKYIYLSMIQRKTFFREIYIEYKAFWYCGTIYIYNYQKSVLDI